MVLATVDPTSSMMSRKQHPASSAQRILNINKMRCWPRPVEEHGNDKSTIVLLVGSFAVDGAIVPGVVHPFSRRKQKHRSQTPGYGNISGRS